MSRFAPLCSTCASWWVSASSVASQERRVEDLFLDLGVHLQGLAALLSQPLLAIIRARGLELLEPLFHLPMIGPSAVQSHPVAQRETRA